ncbi:MAG: SUMF1/EgtB/PvdO family nonheme iron enzyme [Cyclobacteriaceae bacterium]|jgi:gliding motility-associated lipoprotein GldK|nr:SUMF1/EgtB/PvdO family nonheme iron enzyme [Cyclobacteriaceae bacterium]
MNKSVSSKLLLVVAGLAITACGLFGGGRGGDGGELVGAQGRPPGWVMTMPLGMVPIPAGTFHMGQADEDPASTQINFNKQVTIGSFYMDDTEITNNEYRQFTDFFLIDNGSIEGFETIDQQTFRDKYYPDTTAWVRDFSHHMGDPVQDYYYWHPGYDQYPVVGINWDAAVFFADWRTAYWNDYRKSVGEFPMPNFRLPSEAEWEYAARGGRDMAKYPWGNPYVRNAKGCLLANFKPGRGNFYDDGFAYTAPVQSFFPNDYGLYDMAGNVSEWCLDDFNPASVPTVWDLNPQYIDPRTNPESIKYDARVAPKKVVRGGSWKDVAYYLETGTRSYEFKDSTRAYIGFRCALTHLGRSSGSEF